MHGDLFKNNFSPASLNIYLILNCFLISSSIDEVLWQMSTILIIVSTKVELEIKFNIDVELIHENAVESRWISIVFAGEA